MRRLAVIGRILDHRSRSGVEDRAMFPKATMKSFMNSL
jgi:hypothetical protein